MSTKVVKVGPKKCKPFQLQVMVYSPEAGYKFALLVEQDCTPTNDPVWKLVFDLYKKQQQANDFDQIIHVSFTATNPAEASGVQKTAVHGISEKQADTLMDEVYPAVKHLEGVQDPTPAQKGAVHSAMSRFATVNV